MATRKSLASSLAVVATVLAACCSAAHVDGNPFGACAHITRDEPVAETCAMMRKAGMGWVRCDFEWQKIEPRKGQWDFSYFDRVVEECEAAGVMLLPILDYWTWWASPAHEHLDDWASYVRKVVTRYGRRLPVVEVWNEQNNPPMWKNPNPTNYVALLRRTYETVKEVDPGIVVAFGGTAGVPLGYIEEVYRLGGARWFDIMNIHPYSHPHAPEGNLDANLEKLRKLMARYGDAGKPVWISEIGWSTHYPKIDEGTAKIMLAGLRAARPDAKTWRMVYVPARLDESEYAERCICRPLEDALPEGSRVEMCMSADIAARLAKGNVDAVVFPFSEDYAADSMDAVYGFVKKGGVLVDVGGMPVCYPFRATSTGGMKADKSAKPQLDRRRLRIAEEVWWVDGRYPRQISVRPTGAASDVEVPKKGFNGRFFFSSRLLEHGDEFIPLLSARTNGVETVAAATYRFNSDMKGAVVVSGLFAPVGKGCDDQRQARMAARALGIAFAEGVEKFFWYEFCQPEAKLHDVQSFFGLVYKDLAPKPAYGAYKMFAKARPPGSVQKGGIWRSADGEVFFPQWTRPSGKTAGMLWTTAGACDVCVSFSSPEMSFFDVMGRRISPSRTGSGYVIAISGSPVYFYGGELERPEELKLEGER